MEQLGRDDYLRESNARMDDWISHARASFLLSVESEGLVEHLSLVPEEDRSKIPLSKEPLGMLTFSPQDALETFVRGSLFVPERDVQNAWRKLVAIVRKFETPPEDPEEFYRICQYVPAVSIGNLGYFGQLYNRANQPIHDPVFTRYYTGMGRTLQ